MGYRVLPSSSAEPTQPPPPPSWRQITGEQDSRSGPWFNMKMLSYQYRKSHCGDKTVVRSSYLHNGIFYTGKMTSLYLFIFNQDPVCYEFRPTYTVHLYINMSTQYKMYKDTRMTISYKHLLWGKSWHWIRDTSYKSRLGKETNVNSYDVYPPPNDTP